MTAEPMTVAESGESSRSVRERTRSDDARSRRLGRLRRGIEGGLLATVTMTIYRMPVTRSLPPTAEFWVKYVRGTDPEDHPIPALLLHLLYGTVAGAIFALLLPGKESVNPTRDRGPPTRRGELPGTAWGLLYGLVLSVVGERVVLGALLDIEPEDRVAFHVGHVIYGLTLGAWAGTRTREA